MTTTVVKTIGTGGDYTTLQAWEDAAPANLVTSDQIWQGQCFNQEFFSSSAALLNVSGSTTDATRYKELTTYAGASFVDNASVQTNALRYNSSNGAAIRGTYAWAGPVFIAENYFHISKLQILSGDTVTLNSGNTGLIVDKCIVENSGTTNEALKTFGACIVKNSLLVGRSTGVIALLSNGTAAYNCTFVRTGTSTTNLVNGNYSTLTFKNCALFGGATTIAGGSSTKTYTTCYTDTSSPPSGCTTVAYATSTGSGFENKTDSTHDFRIKSTSAMVNAGTVESTHAATDIAGTSRPSGAAYDVGAWEYVSAGGSQTLSPSLLSNSNAFYAPTITPGAVTLSPGLFSNTNSFYAPTITPGAVTLSPGLFTNSNTFFAPTITTGSVTLSPSLLTNSNSFYAPTITTGDVTLAPSLFTNTNTFYAATLTPGEVTLTPSLFTNTNTFYSPVVTLDTDQVLHVGFLADTNSFFAPTITTGEVTLTPDRLENTNQFFAATITPGVIVLEPDRLDNTNEFYGPTVTVGDVSLAPSFFTNVNQFYTAIVSGAAYPTVGRPISDTSNTGWLPSTGVDLYPMVDEVVPDALDYIYATSVGAVCELALNQTAYPGTASQEQKFRASSSTGNSLIVRIKEGATTIRSHIQLLTPIDTEYTITLTSGEIAAITSGSLSVELESA